MEDRFGREVMELDAIGIHQPAEEIVNREKESPVHEIDEADALAGGGVRDDLIAGGPGLHLLRRRQSPVTAEPVQLPLGDG